MKIYNLGSLNVDHVYFVDYFVRPGETISSKQYRRYPGGKGLNQSIAASRAGSEVYHIGKVGKDADLLIHTLLESNVAIDYLEVSETVSGHAIIQVNQTGENCILLFGGSNQEISEKFIDGVFASIEPGSILLLQNEINNLDYALQAAGKNGLKVMFNPSPIDDKLLNMNLDTVTWLVLNEIEGEELTGYKDTDKMLDSLLEKYPDMKVILTLGKDGSIYIDKSEKIVQESYPVSVIDTTAAGDTFIGYYASSIAEGRKNDEALNLASMAAAITVTREGAAISIPWMEEVLQSDY